MGVRGPVPEPDDAGRADSPTAAILDSATPQSSLESGHRAGCAGHKRRTGSTIRLAVDTLGRLLALLATPAGAGDREQVAALAEAVRGAAGRTAELACVAQGCAGERPATAAAYAVWLHAVKLDEAMRGFVPLPRRWVVARSPGPPASGGWPRITDACLTSARACMSWPSSP